MNKIDLIKAVFELKRFGLLSTVHAVETVEKIVALDDKPKFEVVEGYAPRPMPIGVIKPKRKKKYDWTDTASKMVDYARSRKSNTTPFRKAFLAVTNEKKLSNYARNNILGKLDNWMDAKVYKKNNRWYIKAYKPRGRPSKRR